MENVVSHDEGDFTERVLGIVNPGMFFRAKSDTAFPESYKKNLPAAAPLNIPANTVLMVSEVRLVDDVPHTIIFRPHPDWIKLSDNKEIRFLIADFIENFEFAHDGELVRASELKIAQQRIAEIQEEMRTLLDDPAEMRQRYLRSLQDSGKTLPAVIQPTTLPNRITDVLSESVEDFQRKVESGRDMVQFAADQMVEVSSRLNQSVSAVASFYEETAAVAMARVSDSVKHANKVTEGVKSMDLWLGKDVTVHKVKSGASASPDEALVVYQQLLFAAPEMSVFQNIHHEFSADQFSYIIDALQNNDDLVTQILPAKRSVCAMAIRSDSVEREDSLTTAMLNEANKETFLLIRDGENLSLVFSPLWQHKSLRRLFPSASELQRIYTGANGQEINFRDLTYTDAMDRHDRMATTYRRLLVLLGGLQFREQIFGPMCDRMEAINFVRKDFAERHMKFVYDEEGPDLLGNRESLPERLSVMKYSEYINWPTDVGDTVLADVFALVNSRTAPGAAKETQNGEKFFLTKTPAQNFILGKAMESGRDYFPLKVMAPFQHGKNVSVALDEGLGGGNSWDWQLAWMNLDAALQSELRAYMQHRPTRNKQWKNYMRLFKKAAELLEIRDENEKADSDTWFQHFNTSGKSLQQPELENLVRLWRIYNPGQALPPLRSHSTRRKELYALIDKFHNLKSSSIQKAKQLESLGERLIRIDIDVNLDVVYWSTKTADQQDNRLFPDADVWRRTGGLNVPPESSLLKARDILIMSPMVDEELESKALSAAAKASCDSNAKQMLEDAFELDWSEGLRCIQDTRLYKETCKRLSDESWWYPSGFYFGIPLLYGYKSDWEGNYVYEKSKDMLSVLFAYQESQDSIRLSFFPIENLTRIIRDDTGRPIGCYIKNIHSRLMYSRNYRPENLATKITGSEFKESLPDFDLCVNAKLDLANDDQHKNTFSGPKV